MPSEQSRVAAFRSHWSGDGAVGRATDYELLADHDGAFVARSRAGLAALVLPIRELGATATGRRASGCELLWHASLRFVHRGAEWNGAAAALLCTDPALVDTFAVLAADVLERIHGDFSWQSIVRIVEEWQILLTPRGRPSKENELGLWGELWFIERARDVSDALSAWRGPDGDATDFFRDGIGAEVKASRIQRQHFVSQAQLEAPVGEHDSWLLSLWVKVDPGSVRTVPWLVDAILARAQDPGEALRRFARAGYSPTDRAKYATAFTVMTEPEWFAVGDVPRVRAADPGISHMRYRVLLDEGRRANAGSSERLWRHFHEQDYGTER